jgi:hypothetical protein
MTAYFPFDPASPSDVRDLAAHYLLAVAGMDREGQ